MIRWLQSWSTQVDVASDFFVQIWMTWWIRKFNKIKGTCIFNMHIYENLNFQVWNSYAYFRGGQSSWTKWWVSLTMYLNANFDTRLVLGDVHTKNHWSLQWTTPRHEHYKFASSICMSFKNELWNIILLQCKMKLNETCPHILETLKNLHAH